MTLVDETPLWIELDGAVNARAVVPGRAVALRQPAGAQRPRRATPGGGAAARGGARPAHRRGGGAEGPGPLTAEPRVRIEHHSLYPSHGNTDLDAETIKPGTRPWGRSSRPDAYLDESPVVRSYLGYIISRPDSVVAAVRAIARADGAALVHCAAGKDRTGVVVALALDASGVSRETIAEDYLATGERIVQIIERLCSSETYRAELEGHDPQDHAPVPGTIERVLELVDEQSGGAAAWLSANGLDDADLERLRARLDPRRASLSGARRRHR